MLEQRVPCRGVELIVRAPEEDPEAALLYLDGRLIPTMANPGTGRVWTTMLPYQEFDSLLDLGEAVVTTVYRRPADEQPSA